MIRGQTITQLGTADSRDSMTRDEVLMAWHQAKQDLETAKEREMDWRKYVVKRAFPEAKEGTNTLELGNGYSLKAGIKYNYKLDSDLEKVDRALSNISKMGNEGAFVAERLVKWEATFLLTEYRKLCEPDATEIQRQMRKSIEDVLIITDAAPSLEIKEPPKCKR